MFPLSLSCSLSDWRTSASILWLTRLECSRSCQTEAAGGSCCFLKSRQTLQQQRMLCAGLPRLVSFIYLYGWHHRRRRPAARTPPPPTAPVPIPTLVFFSCLPAGVSMAQQLSAAGEEVSSVCGGRGKLAGRWRHSWIGSRTLYLQICPPNLRTALLCQHISST